MREATEAIRAQVGDGRVVCGLSGGIDSAVVAALAAHLRPGGRFVVVEYDADWPADFDRVAARIGEALGDRVLEILQEIQPPAEPSSISENEENE